MTDGIHVELAVSACDRCPVAAPSSSTTVEELRVDSTDDRVQFVAGDPPDERLASGDYRLLTGSAHPCHKHASSSTCPTARG
jgi:hypothetical protein